MKNNPINNILKKILRFIIAILTLLIIIQVFSITLTHISRKIRNANIVNLNSVKTIYIKPNSQKTIEVDTKYKDWISVDPRCYWNFVTKNPDGVAIKFQFRNGTESKWIPNKYNVDFGLWTKTFKVKSENKTIHMTILVGDKKK